MTEMIAQWAPTVVLGVIGFLIRNSIGRYGDRIARVETDVAANHAQHIATFEAMDKQLRDIAKGKADRDEFIRESARTRLSLEKLSEGIATINGKLDSGVHIAAGINRLADAWEARQHDGEDT